MSNSSAAPSLKQAVLTSLKSVGLVLLVYAVVISLVMAFRSAWLWYVATTALPVVTLFLALLLVAPRVASLGLRVCLYLAVFGGLSFLVAYGLYNWPAYWELTPALPQMIYPLFWLVPIVGIIPLVKRDAQRLGILKS